MIACAPASEDLEAIVAVCHHGFYRGCQFGRGDAAAQLVRRQGPSIGRSARINGQPWAKDRAAGLRSVFSVIRDVDRQGQGWCGWQPGLELRVASGVIRGPLGMGIGIVYGEPFDSSGCVEAFVGRDKNEGGQVSALERLVGQEGGSQLHGVIGAKRMAFQ